MTVRAKFRFVVKQYANEKPWIAFEPLGGQLKGEDLPTGIFGFDCPEGTTFDKAEELANYLDKNIEGLTFTAMPLK